MKTFTNWLTENYNNFSDEEKEIANATSRNKGAVGSKALVPQFVLKYANPTDSILDFGAGKSAAHALSIQQQGYNVTAHEFGGNINPEIHDPNALSKKYDIVYASNVLNTQSNKNMLARTLDQIRSVTKKRGKFIGNFPLEPRKAKDIDSEYLHNELLKRFNNVELIGGTKRAPVYLAYN